MVAVLLTGLNLMGQNSLKVGLYGGYGTYQFEDIKTFQADLINLYPQLSIKATEKFPAYLNYSASLEYAVTSKILVGANGGFYTTGGRNHVKDYSGEYKVDMIAVGYRLGLQSRYIFSTVNQFNLYGQLKGGIILSTFKMEGVLMVFDEELTSSDDKLKSTTYFGEPSVGFFYDLGSKFSLDFSLGYQLDFDKPLYRADNKDLNLYDFSGHKVHINWSGIRIAMGISYNIFKLK